VRVVRALEYLEEQGLVELRAGEPRLRFQQMPACWFRVIG